MFNNFDKLDLQISKLFEENDETELTIVDSYSFKGRSEELIYRIANVILKTKKIAKVTIMQKHWRGPYNPSNSFDFDKGNFTLFSKILFSAGISFSLVCFPCKVDNLYRLHGRYWMNGKKAFLVDGSINDLMTDPFSKDPGCLIFGEELDDKDFQILLSIVNLEKNNRSTRTISF
jgi:hypothetical protein